MNDQEPVAWAVVGKDDLVLDSHIYHTLSVAKRNAAEMKERAVPLYRQPQPNDYKSACARLEAANKWFREEIERLRLTPEERWALEYARNACRIVATPLGVGDEGRADAHARVITTLIEKLCGGDRLLLGHQ